MALIVRGSTRCAVCGEVLQEGDEVVGLPHFAADEGDPYWRYTDSGFHASCWADLPERDGIESRINALDREHGYPPRFGEHS
jgi:hypothetical protein